MRTLTILGVLGFILAGEVRTDRGFDLNRHMGSIECEFIYGDEPLRRIFSRRPPNYKDYTFTIPDRDFKNGVNKDPTANYKKGDRFFYFPDVNGIHRLIDSMRPVDEEIIKSYSNNSYLLYTRHNQNSPQFLVLGDNNSIRKSFFDPAKETVFYIHGWCGDGYTQNGQLISKAFLLKKDVNVIILDWSPIAKRCYTTATAGVPKVGKMMGKFISWLAFHGLSYDNIHLIGFSLGAHIVGNAGRVTKGKIRRITALDPAGPLWRLNSNHIAKTDGRYVEVIHTDTRFLGTPDTCGDADFYPNGGFFMPGCHTNYCSHIRSVRYMVSTVKFNKLYANECKSLLEVWSNHCHGSIYPMGNSDLSKNVTGIFRVNTKANYPFYTMKDKTFN